MFFFLRSDVSDWHSCQKCRCSHVTGEASERRRDLLTLPMCNSLWLLLLIAAFSGCVVIAQWEYLPIWICLWHQCGEALTGCYLILVMFSSPVMELCSLRSRLQLSITEPSSKRNAEALGNVWSQQRKVACFWRSVLSCAKLGKPYPFARKDCVASKTTTACGERNTLKIRSACTHNNHSIYMMFFSERGTWNGMVSYGGKVFGRDLNGLIGSWAVVAGRVNPVSQ